MYIPATARGNGLVKPAGQLRLNRNHPAAYGLKHLFMCDGTGMTDLVTGKRYKATGGSKAVDAFGIGWKSGGAGTCIVGPTGAEANKTGNADNGVSVIVSGKFSNSTSAAAVANSYYAAQGGWVLKAAQYPGTYQVGFGSYGVADYTSGLTTPTAEGSVISVRVVAGTTQYRVKNSTASTANATPSDVGDYISVGAGFKFNSATPVDTLNSGDVVYWAAIFDETISAAQADAWHRGPFGSIVTRVLITDIWWVGTAASGTVNYSLTCDAGSYTIAGQDATLRRGYQLTCDAGAYALSGQDANLIVAHQLTCDAGAYTLAGQDATLTYTAGAANYTLTCDSGAYAISGQDATLTYVAGAANYSLTCDAGAYVIAGQDAALNYVPGAGTVNYTLTCDAGAYTIAGQDANLIVAHTLVCDAGAFVIAGQDATLTYVAGAANYSLTCDAGAYVLSGQDAILTRGYQLTCEAGAYTLSGQDATLTYVDGSTPINYTLDCEAGAYVISGQDASFTFTGTSLIDTHDGFWANEYRKMFERKPKVSEVVEIVRENPKETMAVVREMPEVKAVVYAKYPDISYSEVINNAKLQLFIAKQLLNAIESRRDEEDDLAMLLLTL